MSSNRDAFYLILLASSTELTSFSCKALWAEPPICEHFVCCVQFWSLKSTGTQDGREHRSIPNNQLVFISGTYIVASLNDRKNWLFSDLMLEAHWIQRLKGIFFEVPTTS